MRLEQNKDGKWVFDEPRRWDDNGQRAPNYAWLAEQRRMLDNHNFQAEKERAEAAAERFAIGATVYCFLVCLTVWFFS